MSYERLEQLDGLQWPCPTEDHPGSLFLHGRLWQDPIGGPPAPFVPTPFAPPVDTLSDEFPMRLTTGRRLDSFNTGVQTGGYTSPLRRGESLDLHPDDAARLDAVDPKSGTAEFKAAAIRVEKLAPSSAATAGGALAGARAR